MRTMVALVAAAVLTFGLASCAAPSTGEATDPPAVAESSTPTPDATPQPSAIIVAFESISVIDDAGNIVDSAQYIDPAAMVLFLTTWVGPAPTPETNEHYGTMNYRWDGIRLFVKNSYDGGSIVTITAAQLGGLAVSAEALHIGSTRADVVADADYDGGYDADADGDSDLFGLDARPFADADSLLHVGDKGTTYIGVYLTGDVVASIVAPDDDFHDV